MRVVESPNTLDGQPIVATIGFFDGVHLGHRYLIDQVKHVARERGLASAAITFPIHPRKVMQTDYQPALLCGYDERIERLSTTGLDYCISIDFTRELSQLSAREFIQQILKEKYNVQVLLIGYDHRFGHNREDGFEQYQQYAAEVGVEVIQAKAYPDEYVSSSHIRQLLKEGIIEEANHLLGYNYIISGRIVKGFQIGRTIGFPTANIESWERYKVIPAFGVYAIHVYIERKRYDSMLYIGVRPTVQNGMNVSVEANIFDFDGDLYNKSLSAEFLEFIRPDIKFSGLDALREQLQKDKDKVIETLKKFR